MRGRSKFKRSPLVLEEKYGDPLMSKFINKLMMGGKKQTATNIVYRALEKLAKEKSSDPVSILKDVLEKASPILEVRSRRVVALTIRYQSKSSPAEKLFWFFAGS
jgi:small subunit ribosomal protein S7